jgi:deoxycytidylate deaminase
MININSKYRSYIRYANEIRRAYSDPSILSSLCCSAARASRPHTSDDAAAYIQKRSLIFTQFKRSEEIEALRQTYGRLFILISVYSERENRVNGLAAKIARESHSSKTTSEHEHIAEQLMNMDEEEGDDKYGQRLRDTFPLADVFINIDNLTEASRVLDRFLKAFFGSNSVSPTPSEFGMYLAKTASLRSLDLSRQVGSAVCTHKGDVVTLGCNEVPRFGGGNYWCTDVDDRRDFSVGHDENERIKRSILADITRRIYVSEKESITGDESSFVNRIVQRADIKDDPIRQSQLMDLIEFGRIIHAEMSSITDAARRGVSIDECIMYVTTFPCHICAKHIIAAGIRTLYYIEPYPKSYANDLHADAISVGLTRLDHSKCNFVPFIGIAPHRFRDLFSRQRRKDLSGDFVPWAEGEAKPIVKYTVESFIMNEGAAVKSFLSVTEELKAQGKVSAIAGQ